MESPPRMREVKVVWQDEKAPQGRKFLAVGQNVWGRGETPDAAKKAAKKNGSGGKNWIYFIADEKAYINEWGSLSYDPTYAVPEQVIVFVR